MMRVLVCELLIGWVSVILSLASFADTLATDALATQPVISAVPQPEISMPSAYHDDPASYYRDLLKDKSEEDVKRFWEDALARKDKDLEIISEAVLNRRVQIINVEAGFETAEIWVRHLAFAAIEYLSFTLEISITSDCLEEIALGIRDEKSVDEICKNVNDKFWEKLVGDSIFDILVNCFTPKIIKQVHQFGDKQLAKIEKEMMDALKEKFKKITEAGIKKKAYEKTVRNFENTSLKHRTKRRKREYKHARKLLKQASQDYKKAIDDLNDTINKYRDDYVKTYQSWYESLAGDERAMQRAIGLDKKIWEDGDKIISDVLDLFNKYFDSDNGSDNGDEFDGNNNSPDDTVTEDKDVVDVNSNGENQCPVDNEKNTTTAEENQCPANTDKDPKTTDERNGEYQCPAKESGEQSTDDNGNGEIDWNKILQEYFPAYDPDNPNPSPESPTPNPPNPNADPSNPNTPSNPSDPSTPSTDNSRGDQGQGPDTHGTKVDPLSPTYDPWGEVFDSIPEEVGDVCEKVLSAAEGYAGKQLDKLIAKYPGLQNVLNRLGIDGTGIVRGVVNIIGVLVTSPDLGTALGRLTDMALNSLKQIAVRLIQWGVQWLAQKLFGNMLIPQVVKWVENAVSGWAVGMATPIIDTGLQALRTQIEKCAKRAGLKINPSAPTQTTTKFVEELISNGKKNQQSGTSVFGK